MCNTWELIDCRSPFLTCAEFTVDIMSRYNTNSSHQEVFEILCVCVRTYACTCVCCNFLISIISSFYLLTNSSEKHEFIIDSHKQPFFILYPCTHQPPLICFSSRVRSVQCVFVGFNLLLPHAINTSSKWE